MHAHAPWIADSDGTPAGLLGGPAAARGTRPGAVPPGRRLPAAGEEEQEPGDADQRQRAAGDQGEGGVDLRGEAEAQQAPDVDGQRRFGSGEEEGDRDLIHREREAEQAAGQQRHPQRRAG